MASAYAKSFGKKAEAQQKTVDAKRKELEDVRKKLADIDNVEFDPDKYPNPIDWANATEKQRKELEEELSRKQSIVDNAEEELKRWKDKQKYWDDVAKEKDRKEEEQPTGTEQGEGGNPPVNNDDNGGNPPDDGSGGGADLDKVRPGNNDMSAWGDYKDVVYYKSQPANNGSGDTEYYARTDDGFVFKDVYDRNGNLACRLVYDGYGNFLGGMSWWTGPLDNGRVMDDNLDGWRNSALYQYRQLKKEHPDRFQVYRFGDHYELYGEDAVMAAEALGVPLVSLENNDLEHAVRFEYGADLEDKFRKLLNGERKGVLVEPTGDKDGLVAKDGTQRKGKNFKMSSDGKDGDEKGSEKKTGDSSGKGKVVEIESGFDGNSGGGTKKNRKGGWRRKRGRNRIVIKPGESYTQFKNNLRDAVKFLAEKKGGEAVGVASYGDLGSIDLVWGNLDGGLCHVIFKHVGYNGDIMKDFATVDDLITSMEGVFKNGKIIEEDENVCVIADDRFKIVLHKNLNKKSKNWIVTAYDHVRREEDKGIVSKNGDAANRSVHPHDDKTGVGFGTPDNPDGKGSEKTDTEDKESVKSPGGGVNTRLLDTFDDFLKEYRKKSEQPTGEQSSQPESKQEQQHNYGIPGRRNTVEVDPNSQLVKDMVAAANEVAKRLGVGNAPRRKIRKKKEEKKEKKEKRRKLFPTLMLPAYQIGFQK